MDEFPDHFEEYQVPYSNALQCRHKGGGAYFVGPLARWNLNADHATPEVQELARETGIAWPCRNPYVSIVVRALETVYAVEEAIRIIEAYEPPEAPFVAWRAPGRRGRMDHRGTAGHPLPPLRGRRERAGHAATIIPPTSQNQRQIEEDLIRFAPIGARPRRGPGRLALRAGRAQLRPVHQLRDPFPEVEGRGSHEPGRGPGKPPRRRPGWAGTRSTGCGRGCRPASPRTRSAAASSCSSAWRGRTWPSSSTRRRRRASPGRSDRSSGPRPELARCAHMSTHGLGLVEALELAEALGLLPPARGHLHDRGARYSRPVAPLCDDIRRQLDILVECVLVLCHS